MHLHTETLPLFMKFTDQGNPCESCYTFTNNRYRHAHAVNYIFTHSHSYTNAHAYIDPQIYATMSINRRNRHFVTWQYLVQTNTCKDIKVFGWFTEVCLVDFHWSNIGFSHILLRAVMVECTHMMSSIVPVMNAYGNSRLLLFPASLAGRFPAFLPTLGLFFSSTFFFFFYTLSFTVCLSLCMLMFFPSYLQE